jgi:hypothetical protein
VGDVTFVVVLLAFFALAALSVRGCELVLGRRSVLEEERRM